MTIKTQGGKVITKGGKVSCECCGGCRSITEEDFNFFIDSYSFDGGPRISFESFDPEPPSPFSFTYEYFDSELDANVTEIQLFYNLFISPEGPTEQSASVFILARKIDFNDINSETIYFSEFSLNWEIYSESGEVVTNILIFPNTLLLPIPGCLYDVVRGIPVLAYIFDGAFNSSKTPIGTTTLSFQFS
jgi:hypothetical protein